MWIWSDTKPEPEQFIVAQKMDGKIDWILYGNRKKYTRVHRMRQTKDKALKSNIGDDELTMNYRVVTNFLSKYGSS